MATVSDSSSRLSSPWSHIVRRGESDAVNSPPSSSTPSPESTVSDSPADNSGNAGKKPVWNKLSNGSVEVGPVMGADSDSWPALSESAKASPKSSSDSLKNQNLPDGSLQGPLIASSPVNNNNNNIMDNTHNNNPQNNHNGNPNSIPNHTYPARSKSFKRGGGGPSSNANFMVETLNNTSDKPTTAGGPVSSPKDHPHKNNNWETGSKGVFVSQGHVGNDHPRNSYKRGNGGFHPRGDGNGPYHNNYYGNRRDHDSRTNFEWNHHRNFSSRDLHMQPPRGFSRPFIRPPPNSAPFINPPVRPFGNPMGFPEMSSPLYYFPAPPPETHQGVPFVTHTPPSAMFFPTLDPQLRPKLVKQIDYYFSSENLCKDPFLRRNMDEQGWVPISLIAGFKKVMLLTNGLQLTNIIQFILDTIRTSTVVEVQGDKIRKRNDWMHWLLPPPYQFATVSGPPSPATSDSDMLANRIQNVGLHDGSGNHESMRSSVYAHIEGGVLSRSTSGESNGISNGEGTGFLSVPTDNDQSMSARSLGNSDSS
ncbi:la-related protein 1C-like [Tasmannia lanceolata]|uniref:la-related protein 1C-like n=1 Tax=Tasmannia lanceolata TaxID=3420 RepID=UPI004063A8E4